MDKRNIVVIGLIAILAAVVVSAGVAYGANGFQSSTYGGMMGRSQYGGSMMGGGGMMGSGGMMGQGAYQGNYMQQYMQQHWNSTSMPYEGCYQFMQHYWNSTSAP